MSTPRRPELAAEARRVNLEQLARLGGEVRASRRRRRLTQARLGSMVGLTQSTISQLERGLGGTLSMDTWQRVFGALSRRLDVSCGRDLAAEPADAGHLRVQELVLRLGRGTARARTFELPTRPADPARSADVGLRDDRRRILILVECWNTIGDIGGAARSTSRKVADAESLGGVIVAPGERGYAVRSVWVVRATKRNRELAVRYPEVFAARFPGSSARWVAALTAGIEPPAEAGLVWCDIGARRLFAWRRRG
jgi:transcriptional regulator with XRE-family HTH domain